MAKMTADSAWAELWLISDFPIDAGQVRAIQGLFGEGTTTADIRFAADHRICRWPLRVDEPGDLASLSSLVWACAGFLKRRQAAIDQLHAAGCNLELCVHAPGLLRYFSIAAGTMKLLAGLDVQFSLVQQEEDAAGG